MATVDISGLPPPPPPAPTGDGDAVTDISQLPPPPGAGQPVADISALPPPPAAAPGDPGIADLPPPPAHDDSAATGLPDSRLAEIAGKHGVDPEELRSLAPYYGAATESRGLGDSVTQGARAAVGTVGRTVGLGIPQFAAKKLASPEMERALDEVAEAGRSQHPVNQFTEGMVGAPNLGLGEIAGKAGIAARMGEGALIGGGLGVTGSKQGHELEGGAEGAAIGLGLGGAAEALGAVTRRMARTSAERALQEAVPRGAEVDLQRATEEVAQRTSQSEQLLRDYVSTGRPLEGEQASLVAHEQLGPHAEATEGGPAAEQLGQHVAEQRLTDFAEHLTGERPRGAAEAREALAEASRNQGGPDYLAGEYERFVGEQQASTAIREQSLRAGDQQGFFGRAGNSLSKTFTLHRFDERLGTDLSTPYRQLIANYDRSTYALRDLRAGEAPIAAEARRLGVDQDLRAPEGGVVAHALDTGDFSRLTPEQSQVAKQVADHLERVRQFANQLTKEDRSLGITPLSIQPLTNEAGGISYLPHVLVRGDELGTRVLNKTEEALQQVSQQLGHEVGSLREIRPEEYQQLAQLPAIQDLEKAVTYRDNKPVRDGRNLEQRLRELVNPLPRSAETVKGPPTTRAAEAREEGMPDWLLERNVYKLVDMYTANTLRGVYLRAPMEQLAAQARSLRQMGAEVEARFVTNMLQDVQGNRPGSLAEATRSLRTGYGRALDQVTERLGGRETRAGAAVQLAKDAPVILQDLALQIFPNAFAGSPRAAIMHSTAAVGKLMPELGTYSFSAGPRAVARVTKNWSRYYQMSESSGGLAAEMTRTEARHLSDGIRQSALYAVPLQKLDSVNRFGMRLFQFGEHTNRALAQSMAEVMAEDLARGSAQAASALQGMPRSVQRAAAAAPSTEAMQAVIASHLNMTIYNYSRIAKGEVAAFLGPTLSTFSKWPLETAGEILYRYRSKGLVGGSVENAKRFLAPLLLLGAVDAAAGRDPVALETSGKDEAGDRVKKLTGGGGLTHMAPVNAVKPVIGAVARAAGVPMHDEAEAYTPPLLKAGMSLTVEPLVRAFRTGEFDAEAYKEELHRSAHALAASFAPGAWIARTLLDDIPTYITGQRPGDSGDTQLEREQATLRRITK